MLNIMSYQKIPLESTMRYHVKATRIAIPKKKKKKRTSVGVDTKTLEHSALLVDNQEK